MEEYPGRNLMHGGFSMGLQGSVLSTISYLHLCEKNKHTILEFSGWTKLEVTHI